MKLADNMKLSEIDNLFETSNNGNFGQTIRKTILISSDGYLFAIFKFLKPKVRFV